MDHLPVRNPFTDQNQTQHDSIHSDELLKDQNSSSADQIDPVNMFVYFSFNFVGFLSPRPAIAAKPILTICSSNDAVSRKEVPFGGPGVCKNF
jgi:hypothetical protein